MLGMPLSRANQLLIKIYYSSSKLRSDEKCPLFCTMQGKSAVWSHLLAFQLECEEIEEDLPCSQDTNSLSPQAGITLLTHTELCN